MTWNIMMYMSSMFFLVGVSVISLVGANQLLACDYTLMIEWELLSLNSCIIEFTLIFDWISTMFLSFVSIISAMVLFYSGSYMSEDHNINRFIYLVLAFVFSMAMLICSPNIISILLGWDGLGLVSYVLVIYYQNNKSANAGMLTVLSNRIGDVAILLSIACFFSLGSWNYNLLSYYLSDSELILKNLVVLAAMTKSAQIPFSAWLPAAMAAPTPVSALVHSSTLVTAGIYLAIRFHPAILDSEVQKGLFIISSLTMFMAGVGANLEYDLKKIIALSTLSQLGVMMSILALGFPTLAFFHLLTHAIFKALLFMCAGSIIHNVKSHQDIRSMGNLSVFMPLTVTCLNLANLALCGMPFLAGFYSKDLILETASMNWFNFSGFFLYTLATGLTACYTFRLIYYSISGPYNLNSTSAISDNSEVMTSPMLLLSMLAISGGAYLSWVIFPEPHMICLTFTFKNLTLVLITTGALLGYLLNFMKISYINISLKLYFLSSFYGSMWFMPQLSTSKLVSSSLNLSYKLYNMGDKGWSEYLGGQGSYFMISKKASLLQMMQMSLLNLYLKSFFFWVLIMFILLS
uniref:NADH-ubiquinone oxidoreductase chain 5 n=1 Tax=Strahlaxius plectrorhynchus TaxID=2302681 RepID=A0A4Y5QJI1_9EUCA|nr:NADH dehydrogenase subunit 5 [Strahlaxius plectrorhynchus]QCX31785.1 NADH dehydrogenase subunit 5 [Strahlaxius plectrorhynchus]